MDTLKKFFPLSFKYTASVANLIIGILIYVAVGLVAGALVAFSALITGWIPLVGVLAGWVLGIIGTVVDIYVVAGIIIQVLVFAKIIKE